MPPSERSEASPWDESHGTLPAPNAAPTSERLPLTINVRGAAAITTLIMTAKLNDIDPLTWLADVLARIAETAQSQLPELLPWNWRAEYARLAA